MDFVNGKEMWQQAFGDLEGVVTHPADEEIAATLDGLGSEFARVEIGAHLSWCSRCQKVAQDYSAFQAELAVSTGSSDAAWRAFQQRLPVKSRPQWSWGVAWPAAAGFAAAVLLSSAWFLSRPPREALIVEKRVEVPAPPAPLLAANAAVIDLMPLGSAERSDGGAAANEVRLPRPLPSIVTLILNAAAGAGDEVQARLIDSAGIVLWTGTLRRQSGVFTLALDQATLQAKSISIELEQKGRIVARYRVASK